MYFLLFVLVYRGVGSVRYECPSTEPTVANNATSEAYKNFMAFGCVCEHSVYVCLFVWLICCVSNVQKMCLVSMLVGLGCRVMMTLWTHIDHAPHISQIHVHKWSSACCSTMHAPFPAQHHHVTLLIQNKHTHMHWYARWRYETTNTRTKTSHFVQPLVGWL